jgi:ketosteroid isomerase-like protein
MAEKPALRAHAAAGGRTVMRAPVNELPAPVAALIEAANANDTAAFLRSLTADAVVDDWGREFRGADAIRGWSDHEFIGVAVSLVVKAVERAGESTTVTAQVGGRGFNGPSHFTFVVADDLVARMTIRA